MMQKVYLLLRNNQQMGPYSFEELLALHLQPFDLVWIEGKSHGWRYPNEVEILKPYVAGSGSPKPTEPTADRNFENSRPDISSSFSSPQSKKVFVSMPASSNRQNIINTSVDSFEQKAEEIRKRAEASTPAAEAFQTKYSRDLHHVEEDYTHWMYQHKTDKKKRFNKKMISIAAVSILIVSIGWWVSRELVQPAPASSTITTQQEEKLPEPVLLTETESQPGNRMPGETISTISASASKPTNKKTEQENIISLPGKKTSVTPIKTAPQENAETEVTEDSPIDVTAIPNTEETIKPAPIEKKLTLKEKISGLFKNKKPGDAEVNSDPGTAQSNNGERKATRRTEEKETPKNLTDVSSQVEIKTNKIADSWMMGVKNLKLTLVNRSNLTISSAKVEVIYFSEQNNELEKKNISFSNIPPGKSQTLPIPDKRLADRIEHKVLSAEGYDNAYARQ